MSNTSSRLAQRCAFSLALASTCVARSQPPARTVRPDDRVELSAENADLLELVRIMQRATGRHFVISTRMREIGATIVSSGPVSAEEAYRAFLAILHENGLTVVRRGPHHYIRDAEGIERGPTSIYAGDGPPPNDERFVTYIHRVEHVPIADAAQLLETLRSSEGRVITYAPTRTMILIDTGANVRRMRRILAEIDVARGNAHVWVEPVHFADAAEIAEHVRAVFEDDESPAPSTPGPRAAPAEGARPSEPSALTLGASNEAELYRVIPERRTNSLILMATEAGYRRVIALLRELDRPGGAETTARVHRLQHGNATNVAATLSSLLGGGNAADAAPSVAGLRGRVRVEAHTDLNALVVTATPADFRVVRGLIDDLDVEPRQVFLEMVLMELSVDHGDDLNVNVLSGLAGLFGPEMLGLLGAGGGAIDLSRNLVSGIAIGASGPLISDPRLPGASMPTFGVLVHALAQSNQANILSMPSVLVLDNREATINVGQNGPLQGSSVPGLPSILPQATNATDPALTNVLSQGASGGRRDTGTIVRVTPHINDDGQIRLEIDAEDSRAGDVAAGNLGAVALHQSIAQTELVVNDGQTAVIGGLVRDAIERHRSGIPGLSEIPILGALFGQTSERTVRRNLVFFVTPHVVRGPADMRAIYERRMRERREFLDRHMVFEGDWEPSVDYARTRGLVSEMIDTVLAIESEERAASEPPPPTVHVERPPIEIEIVPPPIEIEVDAEAEE